MNAPTPMNDTARDDRFNRGLERLLHGDPSGIDEIDPELQDTAIEMVKLANDAGWIGSDPGEAVSRQIPWWRNSHQIINAVAAVMVVGLVVALVTFGVRVWNTDEGQYGSGPEEIGIVELGPGVCSRAPRTDAEIAEIVRKPEELVQPYQHEGVVVDIRSWTLQTTRDWNVCLASGQWDRALAYESEYFIWYIGWELFPNGPGSMSDSEIATRVIDRHAQITPIQTVDGTDLSIYATDGYRIDTSLDEFNVQGIDAWIVPMDEHGDWLEWPTVVTIAWDGQQFVIVSATRDGMPESPYLRHDALPESTPATPSP